MGLGFGIRVRLIRTWRSAVRKYRQSSRRPLRRIRAGKLHIGSGPVLLPAWTNVDLEYHPGVHHVMDVRDGLPFEDVESIYAEHFIARCETPASPKFACAVTQRPSDTATPRPRNP